jgi:V/A-type H+-transporting ATPase subunit B
VIGKQTREDHPQVMNAAIRLYADAANAKTKLENGFDLSDYDKRTLQFAKEYAQQLLAIDINLDITRMLNITWNLFRRNFQSEELGIKAKYIEQYWEKATEIEDANSLMDDNMNPANTSFKQRNKTEGKWQ